METSTSLRDSRVCPICGQYIWHHVALTRLIRGVYVVCINCQIDKREAVGAWLDGWDAAKAHYWSVV